MIIEEFVDVVNHENDYQISNHGRLLNKHTGYIKYPSDLNSVGYPRHTMYYGKPDRQFVHVMVAKHFVPNPDNKPIVNHLDCNKCNPCADNLEWCTLKENKIHSIDNMDLVEENKLRESNRLKEPVKKNILPVTKVDINGNYIQSFESITKAANNNDTDRVYIQRHLGKYIPKFEGIYYINPVSFV